MNKNVILVDYENVQKIDLKALVEKDALVKVFHGKTQKFSPEFTQGAIQLGKEKIELIQIKGNGKNALDFHIAYFMGKLSNELQNPVFHIISRDKGFRPLVDFVNTENKNSCFLGETISDSSILKPIAPAKENDPYKIVVSHLSRNKRARPRRRKSLHNLIMTVCRKEMTEEKADKIIENLVTDGVIEFNNETVTYNN